jgi:hypothetical protein
VSVLGSCGAKLCPGGFAGVGRARQVEMKAGALLHFAFFVCCSKTRWRQQTAPNHLPDHGRVPPTGYRVDPLQTHQTRTEESSVGRSGRTEAAGEDEGHRVRRRTHELGQNDGSDRRQFRTDSDEVHRTHRTVQGGSEVKKAFSLAFYFKVKFTTGQIFFNFWL